LASFAWYDYFTSFEIVATFGGPSADAITAPASKTMDKEYVFSLFFFGSLTEPFIPRNRMAERGNATISIAMARKRLFGDALLPAPHKITDRRSHINPAFLIAAA